MMSEHRSTPRRLALARQKLSNALLGALALSSVLISSPARAHRVESAMTTIESNSRTQQLEIIHEINYHDLEHVMNRTGEGNVDLSSDKKALRKAIERLADDFSLTDGDDRPLVLRNVGAELDRDRLLIYYEVERPTGIDSLKVFDQMLMEAIPQQVNRVNVRIEGPTRTLIFRRGNGWQELSIPSPD